MLPSNILCTIAVYAVGSLCQVGILPWFALPCVLALVFSRWAFSIHSRTHFKEHYPLVEELLPLVMSPLSVGLNEQRNVHRRHHAFLGTHADPDWLFYNANPVPAVILCFFHPEITFCREWQRLSPRGLSGACFRLALFTVLLLVAGTNFLLWYLLPLRVLFGIAQFIFTWMLHHRQAERTINIHLPPCFTPLIGSVGMKELGAHATHHRVCN